MSDLIYRKDAIDAIMGEYPEPHYPDWFADVVARVPSAQPNVHVSTKEADYISRTQALNAINVGGDLEEVWINVAKLPSAQPERKEGRWQEDPSGYGFWICSACGFVSEASCADLLYNFCPNCGADMRGER